MCAALQGGPTRQRFKTRSRSAEELQLMAADDDDASSLAEVQDSCPIPAPLACHVHGP